MMRCTNCDRPLRSDNSSGLCKRCFDADLPKGTCSQCGGEIGRRNRSGMCKSCGFRIMTSKTTAPMERFMVKVAVDDDSGCWLWIGPLRNQGYGQFALPQKRTVSAHRWAYEQFVGPIPHGLTIDHACNVRRCVNPDHLRPMTLRDNLLIGGGMSIPRILKSRTLCPYGHAYDEVNTGLDKDGRRYCRACKTRRRHERAAKLRMAS